MRITRIFVHSGSALLRILLKIGQNFLQFERAAGGKNKKGSKRAFREKMVIRLGFEPKTHSLEGCCSIQLSYRTAFAKCGRKNKP